MYGSEGGCKGWAYRESPKINKRKGPFTEFVLTGWSTFVKLLPKKKNNLAIGRKNGKKGVWGVLMSQKKRGKKDIDIAKRDALRNSFQLLRVGGGGAEKTYTVGRQIKKLNAPEVNGCSVT